ncbi:MAG TPA: arginine--tRNA ligase [Gammaproteobacteria bacterium]
MSAAGIPPDCPPLVTPSTRPQFGEYQANGAMGAAKALGQKPRDLARAIVAALDLDGIASRVEIAGPGFINLHLDPAWLGARLGEAAGDPRLGVPLADPAQTVVVDYSSPNLAKEMHVGHLRSTIIGDALARLLEHLGQRVVRQNHMGDWGTQFGMLIAHLEDREGETAAENALADLEAFYRDAKQRFDGEPGFADRARDYVVRLQSGDARCLALWREFIEISIRHSEAIYARLNVTLTRADIRAESAYNDDLPGIVATLQQQGLAVTDQGAEVVFLDELADREGKPQPVIVQKSGGGYLYATTDLAALRYRCHQLGAVRILYFIDARQSLHMQQVFAVGRRAGFATPGASLEHHPFGTMMGEDGRPFRTRSGGTVKLAELLDEAVARAAELVAAKDPELPQDERAVVARKVGIGAVKYADLSKARTTDYVFSWNAMLSFEGNTAPYLQYAYSRVRSIFRKAGVDPAALDAPVRLEQPQETALALHLLRFPEQLEQVARDATPHLLCAYLYDLASLYMAFYEACPVLKAEDAALQASRLRLCDAVARTLATGLGLLGIEVMERM